MGKKKKPFYRVVVADSRAPRDGRFIEVIGTYNPLTHPYQVELNEDRIYYWLGNGAQPSTTVKNIFQKKGLWLKWDLMKNGADEAKVNEEFAKWEVIQAEREARIEAEKDQKLKAEQSELKKAEEAAEAEAAAQAEAEAKAAAKKADAEAKAAAKEAEEENAAKAEEKTVETETAAEVQDEAKDE